jgi:hypothetical protein
MNPQAVVAIVLAAAAAVACLRIAWRWRRLRGDMRPWRPLAMLVAQPLLVGLLYLALFPPERATRAEGVLTVLAEGATARDAARAEGPVVALPEAPAIHGSARVPDLATALRRHPGTRALRIVGAGLPARDRDAARGIAVEAVLPPPARGLQALEVEQGVVAGARFTVSGRIFGVDAARVELRDPAGRRVDIAAAGEGGTFALQATAFAPGTAMFSLQVSDGDGARIDSADVPVWIGEAPQLRVLLLAGAPNPETRALRRWMQDAGFDVDARISLGAGMQLGDAPALTTDALARVDLVVADARAWSDLGAGGRAAVLQAVEGGLGLLLRADTPLAADALHALSGPGARIEGGRGSAIVRLSSPAPADEEALRAHLGTGSDDAPVDPARLDDGPAELTRRDWRATGPGVVSMDLVDDDAPAAWWTARGSGRVGIWTLLDTWRLPLSGRADLHADLWNAGFGALARAREYALARIQGDRRVDERVAICAFAAGATVLAPDGRRTTLVADPDAGGCAAFWPRQDGWHALDGAAGQQWFHVLAAEDLPGVRAAALRDATLALAAEPDRAPGSAAEAGIVHRQTASWPWFLGWLLLAAGLWWLERSRLGRAPDGRGTH